MENSLLNTFKTIARYLYVSFITALLLAAIVIAMPQTESLYNQIDDKYKPDFHAFDLYPDGDLYRKGTYIVSLEISDDSPKKDLSIENAISTIHDRLNRLGVEEVKISKTKNNEVEDKVFLQVIVTTTKQFRDVERLLSTRNYYRILEPKNDIDFSDQTQISNPENYEFSGFDNDTFRNVVIRKTQTNSQAALGQPPQTVYQGVFKPKFTEYLEFRAFLKEYSLKNVAIEIDGQITPYQIGEYNIDLVQGTTNSVPEFAPQVARNQSDANLQKVLFDAGYLPASVTLEDSNIEAADSYERSYDFNMAVAGLSLAGLSLLAYLYYREEDKRYLIPTYVLSTGLVIAGLITVLKLSVLPVNMPILLLTIAATMLLNKLIIFRSSDRYMVETMLILTAGFTQFYTEGYVKTFGLNIFYIVIALAIAAYLMDHYRTNLKKIYA